MRKAILLLALLAAVLGQEMFSESVTGQYDSGFEYTHTFQYGSWNNEKDFAIYGWFNINSAYSRADWATGFHFTSNQGAAWQNAASYGDRVLAFWVINNVLHNPTYSVARGTANYYENVNFTNDDLNKWNFIYVAHGSKDSTQFAYYNLAGSGVQTKKYTQITHNTSTFYQIKVGRSFTYKYFPGTIARLTIHGGQGAYRESGFEQLNAISPGNLPKCPVVFTGCARTGQATNVCDNVPVFDVRTIKSIYVPAGYTVTVYDTNNYAGKKVTYNQSIECITQHNFAMLVAENAITIENDDRVALRKNSKRRN